MRIVPLDTIDASRRAERYDGWLSGLYRDPAADPPDFDGLRLHPVTQPDEPKTDPR